MRPRETARSAARRLLTDGPKFVFEFSFVIVGLAVMAAYVIAAVLTIYFAGLTDHWPDLTTAQIVGLCAVVLLSGLAIWKGVRPVMAWIDHLLTWFVQSQAPRPLKVAVLSAPTVLVLLALLVGVE